MTGLLQSLKCCLNPKVLLGLGAVLVGVLLLAPDLVASAFPLLLALVCPLSMLVMLGGMARMSKQIGSATETPVTANTAAAAPSLPVSPTAHLAMLRASQQALADQSAIVATEIAKLEAAEAATAPVPDQVLPDAAHFSASRYAALAGSVSSSESGA